MGWGRFKSIGSLAIGLALLYYVSRLIDVRLSIDAITAANPLLLVLGVSLMVLAYAGRGARWLIWDRSISYRCSLKAVFVGFMGNNLLPARLGEVLRADWVARRSPTDGRTTTLASIVGERLMDGVILSILGIVGVAFVAVDRTLLLSLVTVAAVFALLGGALVIVVMQADAIRRVLDRINRFFPGHLTNFTKAKANYALDGLVRFRGTTRLLAIFVATAGIWLAEVGWYWAVAASISPVSFATAVLVVAVVSFASLFPFTVGGIGVIEGASTILLMHAGVPAPEALAIALVQHVFQLAFTTFIGATVYLSDPLTVRPAADAIPARAGRNEDAMARTLQSLQLLRTDGALEAPHTPPVRLSIVIPAYNERHRLPRTALETIRWCNANCSAYEILIVDDGSSDDTLAIAKLLEDHDRHVRSLACPHKGKGMAVRMGMLNAKGQYVLFMDADGATPLTEIPKLLAQLDEGHSIAIGSRILQNPGEVVIQSPLHRRIIGRMFTFLVNIIAVSGLADTQCGFKMFHHRVVKGIFSRQKLDGFAFDVEVLYIARRLGLSIAEIPVNWQSQEGSKVNLLTDSARMLWDITRIRWLHRSESGEHLTELVRTTDGVPT